jgi:hypothetical protein
MSIAQHQVAGEGGFCRTSNENVNASVVSQTREHSDAAALSADNTTLPWVIHHAQARAQSIAELPQRARNVLAALARTVDAKRPYAAIFAGRALLTGRSGLSERTFYRGLADLEALGLIRRPCQLRIATEGYEGRFGRAHLHLTELAATLLGLVEPAVVPSPAEPAKPYSAGAEPSATGADDARDPAFPEPSATVADGAIYKDLSPASSQKRQPGQVPADLERLRSLGFRKFLIFKLMREAREQGKRLSEVVEACWHGLKKAAKPICYLQALLRSNVDFGFQVRQRNAERDAARDAAAERDAAASVARQVGGQRFVDAKGEQMLDVDADGQGAAVTSVHEGVARRLPSTWAVEFTRALRSGLWRLAGEGDTEAFAEARRARHAARTPVAEVPTDPAAARDRLASLKALLRGSGDKSATLPGYSLARA